ncbi:hypothetical protein FG386_001972 [Cryptosporidium ryanae]|uniref:uncharacterized protein n=1 Tax=Cryptosporidium ryanae TaxID=515981 RepID=UPI00351A9DFD|nr:hypothetical protein FG386_001972 [Cryptosporidium ryanae]
MQGVDEIVSEALESGQTSLSEIMVKREFGGRVRGYTRMRGMIKYFLEQEVYVHSLVDSRDNREFVLDPFRCESFDESHSHLRIGRFASRNVYSFTSVPANAFFGASLAEANCEDLFYDNCEEKFENCVIKLYDFTRELGDIDSVDLSEAFSGVNGHHAIPPEDGPSPTRELKVNEMLEIVSIVELREATSAKDDMFPKTHFRNEEDGCEFKDREESKHSLVFHVVSYKRIPNYSPIRCVQVGYDGFKGGVLSPRRTCEVLASLVKAKFPGLESVYDLYEAAVDYIARSVCEENPLLAEYILLCICNRRKLQFESDNGLDNQYGSSPISLHISFCDKGFSVRLRNLLERNLPRVTWLNLDISSLNHSPMTPYFDEAKDEFITGSLQFPLYRNLVVIDETTLQEGKLTAKGIENMSNIASLVNYGRVNYGFPAYQVPMETETNNIILSENKKSVVCGKSGISIDSRLKAAARHRSKDKQQFSSEKDFENYLRLYISIVSSCDEMISFDRSTQEYIADKFVEIRQKLSSGDNQVNPGIIHHWLMLSRTQALLNGEESLTSLRFDKFIQLERERLNI